VLEERQRHCLSGGLCIAIIDYICRCGESATKIGTRSRTEMQYEEIVDFAIVHQLWSTAAQHSI
jgi:hypothetical protein